MHGVHEHGRVRKTCRLIVQTCVMDEVSSISSRDQHGQCIIGMGSSASLVPLHLMRQEQPVIGLRAAR